MEHFDFLGLKPGSSQQEIKSAYRRLAAKLHPDKGGDNLQFSLLHRAYELAMAQASHRVSIPIHGKATQVQVTVDLQLLAGPLTHSILVKDRIIEVDLPAWQPEWGYSHKFVIKEHDIELTVRANSSLYYIHESMLSTDCEINCIQAMFGCRLALGSHTLTVPAGTQHGQCILVPNQGFFQESGRQPLAVYVKVKTLQGQPEDLNLTVNQLILKHQ